MAPAARAAGLVRSVAAAVLAAIVLLLVFSAFQRRMIYFPFGRVPPPADIGLSRAEDVTIRTDDGLTLAGWFVPPAAPASGHTVVVFNGNGGNRSMRAPLAAALAARHIGSLLFDYRGYGGNPGSPSEEGLALDARAAVRALTARADVDGSRVSYFGESLGTAVAVRLATERPPWALILRSPFTSLVDVGRHHYPFLPVHLLLRDRFASDERIRRIARPLLVVAAEEDRIVPAHLSRALHAAANEPKRLLTIPDADHNDFELLAGRRLVDAVEALLRESE